MNNTRKTKTSRNILPFTLTLLALALPVSVHAKNLIEVYQKAVAYDASLAASKASLNASKEGISIARATLLPSITAKASTSHTNLSGPYSDSYRASDIGITLTQPLFRAQNWFAFKTSELASKKSEADFAKAQQDLMLKVAKAYFNILRAKVNLATTQAAETAFKRQWEQAKEQFDVGLIAITGVLESRASYDSSTTNRIQTEGQLKIAYEELSQLSGEVYNHVDSLSNKFPITPFSPINPKQWVNRAYAQNWSIKAAKYALKQQKEALKSDKAGYYPTLDLFSSYTHNTSTFSSPFAPKTNNAVIGLSFNMPIYSGGGTQANVRKAQFLVEQSRYLLENIRRSVGLNTRSLLTKLKTDIDTVSSRKQNIVSSKSALEATRAGYKVGTRNIVEVLNSEKRYYLTLQQYASARFDYVIDSLTLKRAIGTLSPKDLIAINRWLKPKD